MSPRIALADGERLILEALARSVSAVATVVGIARDGSALLGVIDSARPGVVLMDDLLPGLSGFGLVRALRRRGVSDAQVIILRERPDPVFGRAAREIGVAGLLSRHASVEQLWEAIATVARGARYIGPEWDGGGTDAPVSGPSALTDREVEVLALVAHGLTAEAIAQRLGISERTVQFHKRNFRSRLGVTTTAEAVAWLGRQEAR